MSDAPDKRKHSLEGEPADDEVVDLEALVQDYDTKYHGLRSPNPAERLNVDEDDEALPKRKNEGQRVPPSNRPSSSARRERDWGEFGREFGEAAGEFGRQMGKMGEKFGEKFGKEFGQKFGKDFGEQFKAFLEQPYDWGYRSEVEGPTTEGERSVAALAHATALLTIPAGIFSVGIAVPFVMFLPLFIYLSHRNKSAFVAKHALQAFAALIAGTIGWIALMIGAFVIGVILSIVLAITLVGIIAIPFVWIVIILFWFASLAIPLGLLGFSIAGIFAALRGRGFSYPYVGRWVNRQMQSSY